MKHHHQQATLITPSVPASDVQMQTVALTQQQQDMAQIEAARAATKPWAWALIIVVMYFVPSLIAFKRRHHNRAAIAGLNAVLGWTFIGWVVAFVWSLTVVQHARQS
jgi:hypothetical protein